MDLWTVRKMTSQFLEFIELNVTLCLSKTFFPRSSCCFFVSLTKIPTKNSLFCLIDQLEMVNDIHSKTSKKFMNMK